MKFSICIPNYNYEKYLGRTVRSVLAQDVDLEVVVADNASTDRSVSVLREIGDPRVMVTVNDCNVGFANNLDRAASLASGERMILLSSDDLVRDGALAAYSAAAEVLGEQRAVITSTMDVIDEEDHVTGRIGPDPELWCAEDVDHALSARLGATTYRVDAMALLRRVLLAMKNPFNFAATCYRRADYEAIEGYGGGRLINPDKWFHWRLLGAAETAIWIDAPHFAYRVHGANQTAQQSKQGALKFLVDEYASTLEIDGKLLERAGLSRDEVVSAFVDRDIARHGLATLAKGDAVRARRILLFGHSVYPEETRRSKAASALAGLLALGPVGRGIARVGYRAYTTSVNDG